MDLPSKLNSAYLIIQASGSEITDEILDSEDIHVWHSLKYLPIYILEMIKNDPNDLFHHFFPLSLNRIFRRGALILRAEIIPNNLIRGMPA